MWIQGGPGVRPEIAPVLDGNPVTFEQLQAKVDSGEVTPEQSKRIQQEQSQLEAQMDLVMRELRNIERKAKAQLEQLNTRVVVPLVEELLDDLRTRYTGPVVEQYLVDVQKDILDNIGRFHQKEEQPQASLLGMPVAREEDEFREYQVNVAVDNTGVTGRPVIIETNPKYNNLFGTIERVVDRHGVWRTDLTHIKAGSLIRADGGFLVINALDALVEPWVWTTLKRVLRNRQIEIQPAETGILGTTVGLKPEAIPINVKVIMIGDASIYHILYAWDDDFKKIFKIRADFDTEMPHAGKSVTGYPFAANTFSEIHAYDVLEHLSAQGDWRGFFDEWSEWYRLLQPGGLMCAVSPHWSSPWAWMDPGHRRVYGPEILAFLDRTM